VTPKLALTDTPLDDAVDAIVIGTVQGTDGVALAPGSEPVAEAYDGDLTALLGTLGATGRAEEIVKLPGGGTLAAPLLIAVGLGKPGKDGAITAEQVRRASGAAARALAGKAKAARGVHLRRVQVREGLRPGRQGVLHQPGRGHRQGTPRGPQNGHRHRRGRRDRAGLHQHAAQ
jgi:hypothetical protein